MFTAGLALSAYAGVYGLGFSATLVAITATGGSVFIGTVIAGGAGGFASGLISTGSLRGALEGAVFGGLSAGLAFGIGHGLNGGSLFATKTGTAIAHGVAQGTTSVLRGGKFREGFAGGFMGHMAGGVFKGKNIYTRTAFSAAVGGTISKAVGGKFANGAVSAAFTHLFNAEAGGSFFERSKAFLSRTISVVGGAAQVYVGAVICVGVVTCAGGGVLIAHGGNNIYEGLSGDSGALRTAYQAGAEAITGNPAHGDLAYGAVDIGSSVGGMARGVMKGATLSNYPYMRSTMGVTHSGDLQPAFMQMSRPALGAEIINMTNTSINTYDGISECISLYISYKILKLRSKLYSVNAVLYSLKTFPDAFSTRFTI